MSNPYFGPPMPRRIQKTDFDPEKVERYEVQLGSDPASVAMITRNTSGDYILASDYDKLLALYLAAHS